MNQYGPGHGPSLIFRGLHHTLVPLDSTYGFQGPQQKMHALDLNSNVLIKFNTYILCMLLRLLFWCKIYFKLFMGP